MNIKIRNNKTVYLSKFLFLKNPKIPNGKKIKLVKTYEYDSLNEFIGYGKNEGLTHIVVDGNENRQQFLKDVFENEEKFPYLTKIYDSSEHGYDYHLKIFRIDYEKFESIEFN